MKFIVGTKTGMTQVFEADGTCRAATVLKVQPALIAQVKTTENAVAREFRPLAGAEASINGLEKGGTVDVSMFAPGDTITVSAISKGKGFQGVVKRHGFAGGRRSHGQKHSEREPGSIGAGGVQRVRKGKRMAGRMGNDTVTVKNLIVLQVNKEESTLVISGAVPGRKGTLVEVYGS